MAVIEPDDLPQTVDEALARIAADPDDVELHQRLGVLYTKAGQYAEAWATYERAFALAPRDAWTHLYIGNFFYVLDSCHEALRWFESAAALMPGVPIVYTCQGDVHKALGRYGRADEMYRAAVRADPTDERAQRELARWRAFRATGQR